MLQASLVHVPCIGQYWPPLYMYFVLGNTSLHSTCILYWAIPASFQPVLCIGQYWPPFYMYFVLDNAGLIRTCTLCICTRQYWPPFHMHLAILASFLHVLCIGQCQHCGPPFYMYFVLGNANTAGLPSTCNLYWAMPTLQASLPHALCIGQCQHCRPPFYMHFVLGNANTEGLPSTCTLCWAMPTLQASLPHALVQQGNTSAVSPLRLSLASTKTCKPPETQLASTTNWCKIWLWDLSWGDHMWLTGTNN